MQKEKDTLEKLKMDVERQHPESHRFF